MASIGQKLETKGVIMTLLSLVLISTGCEDKIDSPTVNPSEGKTVEVTLTRYCRRRRRGRSNRFADQ